MFYNFTQTVMILVLSMQINIDQGNLDLLVSLVNII